MRIVFGFILFYFLAICGCAELTDSSVATYVELNSLCEQAKAGGPSAITDEQAQLEVELKDLTTAQMSQRLKQLGYYSEEVFYPNLLKLRSTSSIHWFLHGELFNEGQLLVQCEAGRVVYVAFVH